MEKLIAKDLYYSTPEKLDIFKKWGAVNDAIIKFQNCSNVNVFKFIFGDSDGERLWENFVTRCDRRFDKFRTFLVTEQFNDLLVNIYYNENLYSL